jgi:hypothetical protein
LQGARKRAAYESNRALFGIERFCRLVMGAAMRRATLPP